jgi:hypothetical protein
MLAFGDADYAQAMLRLLPRGLVWRRDAGSVLSRVLGALAPTYTRSTAAAARLVAQSTPAATVDMLAEWEASLGLPDLFSPVGASTQQRQAAVRAKWGARGGLSVGCFVGLAADLGFAVTVTEFTSYAADMACELACVDSEWSFAWHVSVPQVTTLYFSADAACADDPLETYDAAELIARVTAERPAGTTVFFAFS